MSPAHVAIKVSRVCRVAQSRARNDPLSQRQRNSNCDVSFGHIEGLRTARNKEQKGSLRKRLLANGVSAKCCSEGEGGFFAPSLGGELHE